MVTLSVVMSVYNGGASLAPTLESILGQTERDFELIAVDDGSTDDTHAILTEYAKRDARLHVITQTNVGLTRSLIRGCDVARGTFIARHDAGDRSHPERFARQLALLHHGHALVACATKFVDAEGDLLYVAHADGNDVRRSLLSDDARRVHALPSHGSAMFRREAYRAAGGYRPAFRMAQDLDLWIRMAVHGSIAIVPDELYEATIDARSISGVNREAQVHLTRIAVALRDGGDPRTLLAEAQHIAAAPVTPHAEAAALYFIGKCLLRQRNPRGRQYLARALRLNPWHVKAWVSLVVGR
jgi:glycosyltransferase involved in cell wall biosynthesis